VRHPWRLWRWLPCLLPLLRYAAGARDRGALKSRIIQLTLGGVASAPLAAWAVRFARRLVRSGLYAEALECITAHQRNHDHLVLLSASPNLYVPEIAQALRFDACICTEVRWGADQRLDGALSSPIAAVRKKPNASPTCSPNNNHCSAMPTATARRTSNTCRW